MKKSLILLGIFINKIWNAARFVQMQLNEDIPHFDFDHLSEVDKWILDRFDQVLENVTGKYGTI